LPGRNSAASAIRNETRATRRRLCLIALVGIGIVALACPKAGAPILLWNASASVPIGFYGLASRPPRPGALAVIRLPEPVRTLAETRGYLRAGALLIKPVAVDAGAVVCRHGLLVTINGRAAAQAKLADTAARPLPAWSGCIRLADTQVFVLAADPESFDSRYFGPVDRANVLGTALPVWVRTKTPPAVAGASAAPP
jgi:conjugative transfer signal peptidase TraF